MANEESKMNYDTVKKILFWWAITIPVALAFTSGICFVLLKLLK